ncbi:MAG: SH3 domain-containing protein [Caldilinea sp.]
MNDYTATVESTEDERRQPLVDVVRFPSDAHYYEIFDSAGKRRAALTVILSAQMRVMHAELWYYERYRALEPTQAEIFNRAKEIVESNYLGSGFGSELRIIDGTPLGEEEVKHSNPDPIYQPPRRFRFWQIAAGYSALLLILLLFGLLNKTILQPSSRGAATDSIASAPATPISAPLSEGSTEAAALLTTAAAEIDALALQPNTNGLPPSKNANDRLEVGMTVRIFPGYRSFVRSEPGSDLGESVGFMENGVVATILGGPVWMPGNTDTIVWWYVETESGARGWTPANTSELTLLEPVSE